MPCCIYIKSTVMLAACMFHQCTSALRIGVQEHWISFKAAAHCRELA